ncbi:MAG: enoyl-CoA hydratase [Candidatus Petromonas sp.]|jgi:enoyl-CoA hydratase/carnithine racemase|nr:enoyl-CoA hydratase [Candidatus Petromonas sp.]
MISKSDILFKVDKGIGWIKLNRPKKLNALSYDMIKLLYEQLIQWKDDERVAIIVMEGEGNKALCSGGDVRHLYDRKDSNLEEYAFGFFYTEYCMNMTMHCYPKPIVIYMNGIVMGGGVGVAVAGSHRIVNEKTKWAMPEMNIGLYPDVGGSYFLNKMPGHLGRYLALTSKSINAADVLYIGAADYYIDSSSWHKLKQAIGEKTWTINSAESELKDILNKFQEKPQIDPTIPLLEEKINKHFALNTVEDIVNSLEKEAGKGDEWAEKIVKTILSKSPTSLKVTLRQLIEGQDKSLLECFKMELELSMNFMKSHDFFEGVRSVLVDKDRTPNWKPDTLEKIKEEDVKMFFQYDWKDGKNPLESFR